MTTTLEPNPAKARSSIAGPHAIVRAELADFATAIERFRAGKIPEASFLELRLRHGVYGQRQDGVHMIRSKLPLGLLAADQLDAFADLTEAYASGVAHLTTRQDIQVHFVPLTQTPDLMRVLADAELTSREACGNVVRNVTATETAGIEPTEAFDVTGYGMALAQFLLRHPDGQSLGRKFKITLSGSFDPFFNQGPIHDLGATAVVKDGVRGFHVLVGGGLGPVPHEAQLLTEFTPATELLPVALSVLRVFSRHGEKKNRAKARLKFLVAKWGIDEFRRAVFEERAQIAREGIDVGLDLLAEHTDGRWDDQPLLEPEGAFPAATEPEAAAWLRTNVLRQSQPGYAAVRVRVPRGDLSPDQLRGLARVLRAHTGDTLRLVADQSILIRFVPYGRLLAVRAALQDLGLGRAGAGGLSDPVTCPGADSCKLGITSPRGVARHIEPLLDRLAEDQRLERLRIKISGCPNSCVQQQTADIGLFGAARTVGAQVAPHYILFVGGRPGGHRELSDDSGYGVNVARVPALKVGAVIERLTTTYLERAEPRESFADWSRRCGRGGLQALVADLLHVPTPEEDPTYYREVGVETPFEVVRGTGECAGKAVLASDLFLVEADQKTEATAAALDRKAAPAEIRRLALEAMVLAAKALISTALVDANATPHEIPSTELETMDLPTEHARAWLWVAVDWKQRFYDAGRIYEGVGAYFLNALQEPADAVTGDRLRRLVVEAGLFVEEAHSMIAKMEKDTNAKPKLVKLGQRAEVHS